jgi:hypothetical protein
VLLETDHRSPELTTDLCSFLWTRIIIIIIIISSERRPLLDIGLLQRVQKWPVLRHPHQADSRDLSQVISPLWGLPTPRHPVRGRHSRTFPPQRPSVLRTMCPAHCQLSSAIQRAISVRKTLLKGIFRDFRMWVIMGLFMVSLSDHKQCRIDMVSSGSAVGMSSSPHAS